MSSAQAICPSQCLIISPLDARNPRMRCRSPITPMIVATIRQEEDIRIQPMAIGISE